MKSQPSLRRLPLQLFLLGLFLVLATFGAQRTNAQDAAAKNEPKVEKKSTLSAEDEYELFKLLADTVDQIERNYVKDISRRELMEAAIRGMLSKLDQYSNYIPPTEMDGFKGSVESEFGGIGIQISIDKDKEILVVSPLLGTPAYRAGVLAGDKITEINGQATKNISIEEAVKRMKGKSGTEVTLKIVRGADGKTETLHLKREVVRVETVMSDRRKDNDSWDYMLDHEKKIGYVRIISFGRHTTEELTKAIKELSEQKLRGLILDLRFNPGGLLTCAIEVSDLFVTDGRIVSTSGRNVPERTVDAKKEGTYSGFPIAILVNRFSASASEIVSACLQDHKLAVVIGERTWGKGSVQNIVELEEGKSALKLTTAAYHRPNGKNIHRFEGATETDDWGVRPNDGYEIKLSDAEWTALMKIRRDRDILKKDNKLVDDAPPEKFVDRQLQKAREYLAIKLGDAPATPPAEKKETEKKDADKQTAEKSTTDNKDSDKKADDKKDEAKETKKEEKPSEEKK